MENIKSFYFIRIIFSYLNEKTKLEFVKINKNLQKLIDVDIYNYRIFNHIYSKGIVWKGEYLNGKKNGKGKEKNCYGDSFLTFPINCLMVTLLQKFSSFGSFSAYS